ncbi:ribonuclease H-like domain-containing protein [Tanacetum coccineum]
MVQRTLLTRSGPISLNIARPMNTVQARTTVNNAGLMKDVKTVKGTRVNTARPKAVLSAVKGDKGNAVKASSCWVWRPKHKVLDHVSRNNGASMSFKRFDYVVNPQQELKDKGVIDNRCSRHMTGKTSYLTDYEDIDGGFVAFGGNSKGGKITRKGKIRTGKLNIKDVYFVKELKFNLFSVSQMCDKKNSVLFTDTECVVLSLDFKLTDESHVLLKVPRKDNMYSIDLKNVVSQGCLTCLFAKATPNESNLWHRRLGHVNFKTINKLVKGNLVRGLPSKLFDINQTCIACQKGNQHKASCQLNQFCEMKGIKREFSVARNPQQNGVAEKKNRTLIEAARTMLAVSKLPTTFWADAINTACYVQNRVLVIKPHNKTPYEPFLGKFNGKADEGFFVRYSTNSKAFRVFNSRTRILEENLHVKFNENTPNIARSGNQRSKARVETVPSKDYILLPLWTQDPQFSSSSKDSHDARLISVRKSQKSQENSQNQASTDTRIRRVQKEAKDPKP